MVCPCVAFLYEPYTCPSWPFDDFYDALRGVFYIISALLLSLYNFCCIFGVVVVNLLKGVLAYSIGRASPLRIFPRSPL
jgi:hypothetical protein